MEVADIPGVLESVVPKRVEEERPRIERKEGEAWQQSHREAGSEGTRPACADADDEECRDCCHDDEPGIDRQPEQQTGTGKPAGSSAPFVGEQVGAEHGHRRERECLDDREVAHDEPRHCVQRERDGRRQQADLQAHMTEEERSRRKSQEDGEKSDGLPRLAREPEPRPVDVRQERGLLVEEVPVRHLAVDGKA